jgi:hypothetical protein
MSTRQAGNASKRRCREEARALPWRGGVACRRTTGRAGPDNASCLRAHLNHGPKHAPGTGRKWSWRTRSPSPRVLFVLPINSPAMYLPETRLTSEVAAVTNNQKKTSLWVGIGPEGGRRHNSPWLLPFLYCRPEATSTTLDEERKLGNT